jgi:hypothetical protein
MFTQKATRRPSFLTRNGVRRTLIYAALLSACSGAFALPMASPCGPMKKGDIGYDYCMSTIGGSSGTGYGTSGAGGIGVGGLSGGTNPIPNPSGAGSSGPSADDPRGVFGSTATWPKGPREPKPPGATFCKVDPKTHKKTCIEP